MTPAELIADLDAKVAALNASIVAAFDSRTVDVYIEVSGRPPVVTYTASEIAAPPSRDEPSPVPSR